MKVVLKSQKDVIEFCNAASRMKSCVTIPALNSIVNASSLMGIMTLDLSQPITLICDKKLEAEAAFERWKV